MGIFGSDDNDQPYEPAGNGGAQPDNGQSQQTYIDGVMAPTGDEDNNRQRPVNGADSQVPEHGGNQQQSAPADYNGAPQIPVRTPDDNNPAQQAGAHGQDSAPVGSASQDAGDLSDIKQQALKQLSPLVGHLDQAPEEKFHTTMMMLQATDDQNLVKAAFDAAKDIPDDKARAQALMDVINEINYFTQSQHQG